MSTADEDSVIETASYRVGTFPGGSNILGETPMQGNTEVAVLKLPEFAERGGRSLFFTTTAVNTEGLSQSGSCSITTFDVTDPDVDVSIDVQVQSDRTTIRGAYAVVDDSPITRIQYAIGRGTSSTPRSVDWRELPVAAPPKEDQSTGDPLKSFKELASQHMYYFVGKADKAVKGVSRGKCATTCLLMGAGVACKGFDYSASNKQCVLHTELGNDETTKLIKFEDYGHFVRSDAAVSQVHEGTIEVTDLVLDHNNMYHIMVRARNSLGYTRTVASPPVLVDLTPPYPGFIANASVDLLVSDRCNAATTQRCIGVTTEPNHRIVVDGLGSAALFNGHVPIYDKWYTRYNTFMMGNWDGLEDQESDLYQVLFAAGSSECSSDVFDWGDPHSHLKGSEDWTHSGTAYPIKVDDGPYHVSTKILNNPVFGGSLVTSVCHSEPYIVDTSPPNMWDVHDTVYNELTYVCGIKYNTSDDGSHILEIQFGLGNSKHDVFLRKWDYHCVGDEKADGTCDRTHKRVTSPLLTQLAVNVSNSDGGKGLPEGVYVWVRIAVLNNVELAALEGAHKPFLIDTSPPLPGYVNDGPYVRHDLYWENEESYLAVNFDKFHDDQSGIGRYDLCVGTTPGKCETVSFFWLKDEQGDPIRHGGVSRIKVDLEHNTTYYSTVKAYNQGHKIYTCTATSDGVRVDSTKPLKGVPFDSKTPGLDREWTSQGHVVDATWLNFTDPESDVVDYTVSVGDKEDPKRFFKGSVGCGDGTGFFDHMPSVRCPTSQFQRSDFHNIKHGMTYFIAVEGMNGAHDVVSASTNGVTVDTTPPILLTLGDGNIAGRDLDYTAAPTSYTINFDFEDLESGVAGYQWAVFESLTPTVGEQIYPAPDQGYAALTAEEANAGKVTAFNLKLITGVHYFAKLIASNAAGLDAKYETDGAVVDLTPPTMDVVKIGSLDPLAPEDTYPCEKSGDMKCAQDIPKVVYWAGADSLQANWAAKDAESGILGYTILVRKYTEAGGGAVVGNATYETQGELETFNIVATTLKLSFKLYNDYQLCLIAIDGATTKSAELCSTPFHVLKADVVGDAYDGYVLLPLPLSHSTVHQCGVLVCCRAGGEHVCACARVAVAGSQAAG